MTKLRAFTIHLITSIVIFLISLSIMLFIWYPSPYFEVDGGWKILQILAGVDLLLGPLLTLLIFKPGKPGLKFDMSCIVLLQLAALFYGGTIIYKQRPEFIVFAVDQFITTPAETIDFTKLKHPELKHRIGIGPVLVNAHFPEDPKARQELMFQVLHGEKDIESRPELYKPYRPDMRELRHRSINLTSIITIDENAKRAVNAFIAKQGGHVEDYLYFPLRGKNKDIIMVVSSEDGSPVGSISISPWNNDHLRAP